MLLPVSAAKSAMDQKSLENFIMSAQTVRQNEDHDRMEEFLGTPAVDAPQVEAPAAASSSHQNLWDRFAIDVSSDEEHLECLRPGEHAPEPESQAKGMATPPAKQKKSGTTLPMTSPLSEPSAKTRTSMPSPSPSETKQGRFHYKGPWGMPSPIPYVHGEVRKLTHAIESGMLEPSGCQKAVHFLNELSVQLDNMMLADHPEARLVRRNLLDEMDELVVEATRHRCRVEHLKKEEAKTDNWPLQVWPLLVAESDDSQSTQWYLEDLNETSKGSAAGGAAGSSGDSAKKSCMASGAAGNGAGNSGDSAKKSRTASGAAGSGAGSSRDTAKRAACKASVADDGARSSPGDRAKKACTSKLLLRGTLSRRSFNQI